MVLLSASRKYHQLISITSDLLYYKLIIYKSHNNTNQYIFLIMTTSINTRYRSITYKESLAIVPSAYPTSPYLSKYDLNNINSNMKTMNYNINSKIKTNLKASLLWFRNLHIQVLRQTSMKKDSQRYHPNSQTMKTASKNWASKTQRSSPCTSRSKNLHIKVPIQTSMRNNSQSKFSAY